jgi:hypothetical protein
MFIDIGRIFDFDVKLTSHSDETPHPDDDEIAVSINVVEGIELHMFKFEARNLFENDVFVLTADKKIELEDDLMADPKTVAAIDFMIDSLIKDPGISISIDLRGNFVGSYLGRPDPITHSEVESDTTYQFFFTRDDNKRELEKGEEDAINYPPLRYGFGRVAITEFEISITIDSYVSPLWSRLDEKIFRLPVPSPGEVARKAALDDLTNYYTFPLSDAYVDRVGGDPHPSDSNHLKLPSYNPILSGLRSFGLAEALNEIIVARATANGRDPIEIATIRGALQPKLMSAQILSNELLGIGKPITFQHYLDFR